MNDLECMAALTTLLGKSNDPNTQTAALIVRNGIIVWGDANRTPPNIHLNEARCRRPEKYYWIEHAERNTILEAGREGRKVVGGTMYSLGLPCADCARAIIISGIKEIVVNRSTHNVLFADSARWAEDFKRVTTMFEEAGVKLRWWNPELN